MRRTWLPVKSSRARACLRSDVEFARRRAGAVLRRPRSFILEPVVRERLLRIVALDHHVAAAVVADRHDAVAVGQRLDREAVFRQRPAAAARACRRPRPAVGVKASRSTSSLGAGASKVE